MFDRFQTEAAAGAEKSLHYGIQLSVNRQGETYDIACGERQPREMLSPDDPVFWLSAAKPITALAILQLQERNQLSLSDRLSDHFLELSGPEFQAISLAHLLTHTSPLQEINTGWPAAEWDEIVTKISRTELKADWIPGERAAYLPSVSWFLLGAIIEQTSQRPFAEYIESEILHPLDMRETFCLADPNEQLNPPLLYDRVKGSLIPSAYQERLKATTPSPGSSFRGPARDLRKFYDFLRRPEGTVISSETIDGMTRAHRADLFDETLQHKVDYGWGVILDSKQYGAATVPYGFGNEASRQTFGHGGSQCAIGFADPVQELSVVIIANGRPGEGQHQRRFRQLLTALEEDLNNL